MEKSNFERLKEAALYAPVGAFGFVKDNAPTFFNMFVSRGKREVSKTAMSAEETIASTKEHGQFVAMGTPVVKSKAENLAKEAMNKGEQVASSSLTIAMGALSFAESAIKGASGFVSDIVSSDTNSNKVQSPNLGSVKAAASVPSEPTHDYDEMLDAEIVSDSPPIEIDKKGPTFVPSEFLAEEGSFIAEPVDKELPERIRLQYMNLSAPEIIDMLDEFKKDDLSIIKEFEQDFRNRQTIIHAIDYRLNNSK